MTLKVYRSSAGSGKTYTLVKEFLKLCLKPNNLFAFKEILAITFTNKAAAEMKSRLIETLDEAVNTNNLPSIAKDVAAELNWEDDKMREQCKKVLSAIIHQYGSLSISTIDKFMHKLIRSFSYDLELPSGFDITTDSDSLLIEAINNLVDKAGNDKNLTRLLLLFSEWRAEEQKSFSLKEDLLLLSKKLLSDESYQFYHKLKDLSAEVFLVEWKKLNERKNKLADELFQFSIVGNSILAEIPDTNQLSYGSAGFPSFLKKLSNKNQLFSNIDDLGNKNLDKIIEKGVYKSAKCLEINENFIQEKGQLLANVFLDVKNWLEIHSQEFILCNLFSQTIFTTALINEVAKEYEAVKRDGAILPINEFNFRISEVIDGADALLLVVTRPAGFYRGHMLGVYFINDLEMARQHALKQRHAPTLQRLWQQRVVRVGERGGDDRPGAVPSEALFVEEDTQELDDRDRRVGIIELHGDFLGEIFPSIAGRAEVAADDVSQRAGDEEILLHKPELFAVLGFVVRVENF